MNRARAFLGTYLPFLVVFGVCWALFQARYCRSVTLKNLAAGETQTVTLGFKPCHVFWKVTGDVDGSGILVLSDVYSNQVSGKFSFNGRGDYYGTNATVTFIPEGKVSGKIKASFRFHCWY